MYNTIVIYFQLIQTKCASKYLYSNISFSDDLLLIWIYFICGALRLFFFSAVSQKSHETGRKVRIHFHHPKIWRKKNTFFYVSTIDMYTCYSIHARSIHWCFHFVCSSIMHRAFIFFPLIKRIHKLWMQSYCRVQQNWLQVKKIGQICVLTMQLLCAKNLKSTILHINHRSKFRK